MYQIAVLRSGTIVILVAILTLPSLETSARSLGLKDDLWTSVSKKNSWWSKKSVLSVPDYPRVAQESPYMENIIEKTTDNENSKPYTYLFSCYVQNCVPKFIHCIQASSTMEQSSACKRHHEMCADLCSTLRIQDVSP
ncbi:hypothetical protein BsWGS_20140 [Bradybaena similaris]